MQRAEPLRVGDRVTAEALVAGVLGNMAALEAVLAEEAAYVREGRLQEGVAAAEPKAALAAAYMQGLEVAKANAVALKRFHPEESRPCARRTGGSPRRWRRTRRCSPAPGPSRRA